MDQPFGASEQLVKMAAGGIPANPTVDQQLQLRKAELERQLATTNGAIAALEENPEMLRVFNLLIAAGVHRY